MTYTKDQLSQISDALTAGKPVPAFAEPVKRRNEESWAQKKLITWWDLVAPKWGLEPGDLFAIPNQIAGSVRNASRMKDEGLRAGTFDLFLMVGRMSSHGLFIEMKAPYGKLSPSQKLFLPRAQKRGYMTAVCYTLRDAQAVITEYLK